MVACARPDREHFATFRFYWPEHKEFKMNANVCRPKRPNKLDGNKQIFCGIYLGKTGPRTCTIMALLIDSYHGLAVLPSVTTAQLCWQERMMTVKAISFVALTVSFLAGPATGFSSAPSTSVAAMRHPFAAASGPLTRRNIERETVRCQEQQGQVSVSLHCCMLSR